MFKSLRYALPLFLLTLGASVGSAQTQAAWNRRISDIHIVHPPGSPPGMRRVEAQVEVSADDSIGAGANLSASLMLSVNGLPLTLNPVTMTTLGPSACTSQGQCTIGPTCRSFDINNVIYTGNCDQRWEYYNNSWNLACRCFKWYPWISVDFPFWTSSDMVRVTLVPDITALPELVTNDDFMEVQVGENNPAVSFCGGDGTITSACPCGNVGASGHGCANSVNAAGAVLSATGFSEADPLTGLDSVVLHGSGMPSTSPAIYLKSNNANAGGIVFGDGIRCVTGTLVRMSKKFSVGGQSQFPDGTDPAGTTIGVAGGTPPGSGLVAHYQLYYRDAGSFCTPATWNMSNALTIVW